MKQVNLSYEDLAALAAAAAQYVKAFELYREKTAFAQPGQKISLVPADANLRAGLAALIAEAGGVYMRFNPSFAAHVGGSR